MSLTHVKSIIDQYITNSVLNLPTSGNQLQFPAINAFLGQYWGATLQGTGATPGQITQVNQQPMLTYTFALGSNPGFWLASDPTGMATTLSFTMSANEQQLVLSITLTQTGNYSLAEAFPILDYPASQDVGQLVFTNSTFTLNSGNLDSFMFSGTLSAESNPILSGIPQTSTPVPIPSLPISGDISYQQFSGMNYPTFCFPGTPATLFNITLGAYDLALTLQMQTSVDSTIPGSPWIYSDLLVITSFSAGGIGLDVVMPLYAEPSPLTLFSIQGSPTSIKGFSDLSGFTGSDPTALITAKLPDGAKFAIQTVDVVYDADSFSLVSMGLGVTLQLDWTIIPSVIELIGVGAQFTILEPGHPELDNTSALLTAQLKVASVYLDASVLLPPPNSQLPVDIQAGLAPGDTIDITDMLSQFASGVDLPFTGDSVIIESLNVYASISQTGDNSQYSLEAQAGGSLDITSDLKLESFSFFVTYADGALSLVQFNSELFLPTCGISIYLAATYNNEGSSAQWSFNGSTFGAINIPMGSLIADLASLFGITVPTGWLNDVTITNIDLSFIKGASDTITYTMTVDSTLTLSDQLLDVMLTIEFSTGDDEAVITGSVTVDGFAFKFSAYDPLAGGVKGVELVYTNPGNQSVDISTLAADISPSLSGLIPDIELDIQSISLCLYQLQAGDPYYCLFSLQFSAVINFQQAPVVGSVLSDCDTIEINSLQIVISTQALTIAQQATLSTLCPFLPQSPVPQGGIISGSLTIGQSLNVPLLIEIGKEASQQSQNTGLIKQVSPQPGQIGSAPSPVPSPSPSPTPSPSPAPTSGNSIQWVNIEKSVGPVSFQKLGLGYQGKSVWVYPNLILAKDGIEITLDGFEISTPVSSLVNAQIQPTVQLTGLGLAYQNSAVKMSGAFIQESGNYYGDAVLQIGTFGLSALGGYVPASGGAPASFFIYATMSEALGGPPACYIMGWAFGMGVNYSLNAPTIHTLPNYPLLPNNAPSTPTTPQDALTKVLPQLVQNNVLTVENGENWLAAGVKLTSYNMITSFVLVTVSFGVNTTFDVLGSCSMKLPKDDSPPLAFIELDLSASINPATGLIPIIGVLSPSSYLWSSAVALSGGFAFYIWYAGEHRGDFVFTVGGYNPSYTVPANYPVVPRVGINFTYGPFHVIGNAYLALTPGAFMAGFQFTASWSWANISAWYTTGIDFLMNWAPFSYSADGYVEVGCSVNLALFTLHVSVGARAVIWGPKFGGQVHVDLDVITFTIHFGSSQITPTPVAWSDIEKRFLPSGVSATHQTLLQSSEKSLAAKTLGDGAIGQNVSASVGSGLLKTNFSANGVSYQWQINPHYFEITTATKIPANNVQWATNSTTYYTIPNQTGGNSGTFPSLLLGSAVIPFSNAEIWNPTLNVKPMNLSNVGSTHTITLLKADETGTFNSYVTALNVMPILSSSSCALWGDPTVTNQLQQSLLASTFIGLCISPVPRSPFMVNNIRLIDLIYTFGNTVPFSYTSQQVNPNYTVSSSVSSATLTITVDTPTPEVLTNENYILSALTNDWVTTERTTILEDLSNYFTTYSSTDIHLKKMATTQALTDWPMIKMLGD